MTEEITERLRKTFIDENIAAAKLAKKNTFIFNKINADYDKKYIQPALPKWG